MTLFKKLAIAASVICTLGSATAQDPQPPELPLRLCSWGDYHGTPLFVETTKGHVKVDVYNMVLSPVMKAKIPLVLYKEVKTAQGKPTYEAVLSIPVPPNRKMPLVLLRQEKDHLSAYVGECSPEIVPYEGIAIANFSKSPLGVKVGTTKMVVPPGGDEVAKDCGGAPMEQPYPIEAYVPDGAGASKMVYESADVRRPSRRMFVFFYNTPDEGIGSSSITDFKEVGKDAPKP